ncbi:hypothetical protein LP415_02005 [Polaromonas sp. P1(28)-8]|nr:hypothetical protein LP415_02005 [Polaromonas sp. P1(28)-8]
MPFASERIPLRHAAAQRLLVRLREPQGSDELALDGVDTRGGGLARSLDRRRALPGRRARRERP